MSPTNYIDFHFQRRVHRNSIWHLTQLELQEQVQTILTSKYTGTVYDTYTQLLQEQVDNILEFPWNIRLNNHRQDAHKLQSIPFDQHFQLPGHNFTKHARFILIEQIPNQGMNPNVIQHTLQKREDFWIKKTKHNDTKWFKSPNERFLNKLAINLHFWVQWRHISYAGFQMTSNVNMYQTVYITSFKVYRHIRSNKRHWERSCRSKLESPHLYFLLRSPRYCLRAIYIYIYIYIYIIYIYIYIYIVVPDIINRLLHELLVY